MRPEEPVAPMRARGIETRRFPAAGRLAIAAERACRHRTAMHYLLTADVTAARRLMAMSPQTLSLTGFVTASVARTVAETPVVHAYRDWRGRLVTHRHVDVMVPIEQRSGGGSRIVPHVVADADARDITEISTELLAVGDTPTTGVLGALPLLPRVPGLARAASTLLDRSVRQRRHVGTVLVATSGMRDIGEAFGVAASPLAPLMPLQVVIGSVCPHQHRTSNIIEQHEILNLTLTFDRSIVSTAQAARFATRLCSALEHAEVLQAHGIAPRQPSHRLPSPSATAAPVG
ncbi:hypothetical protein [Catenulispora subtropica]|uniref:Catalytic domain of components of various dehydrogenase complexes n=1 Tax=Catenulispora subtropica TaxID=450798 RepID=A0ABN2TF51_9ACTN